MPDALQPGASAVATRAGPIHAFGDPDAESAYKSAADPNPVPVVIRFRGDDLPAGRLVDRWVQGGTLHGRVEWPGDAEDLAGDEPAARCEFDDQGRLLRMVVDLDDEDPGPDDAPGDDTDPSTDEPDSPIDVSPPVGGRAEMAGPDGTPLSRRQAEMAANENRDETQRDQAEMAGRGKTTEAPVEPNEVEALRKALAETNRKHKADRLRLEELQAEEQRKKDEELSESDRLKRDRETVAQRASEAERRAIEAERRFEEATLERLVEREARKIGFEHPELAFRLIDRDRVRKDEETGRWEGAQLAVEKLGKEYPNLLQQRRPGPGTPPREDYPGNPARRGNGQQPAQSADPFEAAQASITYERM